MSNGVVIPRRVIRASSRMSNGTKKPTLTFNSTHGLLFIAIFVATVSYRPLFKAKADLFYEVYLGMTLPLMTAWFWFINYKVLFLTMREDLVFSLITLLLLILLVFAAIYAFAVIWYDIIFCPEIPAKPKQDKNDINNEIDDNATADSGKNGKIGPVAKKRSKGQKGDEHTKRYSYKEDEELDQQAVEHIQYKFTSKDGRPGRKVISSISI